MKRTWAVRPDRAMQLRDGSVVEFVSREAAVEGYMDALSMQDRAGGVISIVSGRAPTDLQGEMVTTGLVFEWKDRVEATASPERLSHVVPEPMPEQMVGELDPDPSPEELEAALERRDAAGLAEARAAHAEPDGLDRESLEEEDVDAIPTEMR